MAIRQNSLTYLLTYLLTYGIMSRMRGTYDVTQKDDDGAVRQQYRI